MFSIFLFIYVVAPESRKAIIISCASLWFSYFCGIIPLLSFVTAIFVETGSSMSPQNSSILVVAIQFIGNLLFLTIADRFNRRVKSIKEYSRFFYHFMIAFQLFLVDNSYLLIDSDCNSLFCIWTLL